MNYVKLIYYNGFYSYQGGTSIEVQNLGTFLSSDVGCRDRNNDRWWQDWAVDDSLGMAVSGNITALEKEGDYVYLSDLYDEEEVPTALKMSRKKFVQLLDEWQEKVCKYKPTTVIIKQEGDQFFIETSDT